MHKNKLILSKKMIILETENKIYFYSILSAINNQFLYKT